VTTRRRIAYLAHGDASSPTSRYRIFLFREALAAAGLEVDVLPAFDGAYFAAERHTGVRRWARRVLGVTRASLRRAAQIPRALGADGLVIERESFPWAPPVIEWLATMLGRGYVLELDDAVYLSPGRRLKYDGLLARSRAVIAGNATLAQHATGVGATAHVVPTVVDTRRYRPRDDWALAAPPRLGWVGLASNLSHLASIAAPLARTCARTGACVQVVSARPPRLDLPLDFVPWREANEPDVVRGFDVGLMPLEDTPFARGKCGLKILQYMAAGVPVVASPVGVNAEIIRHGHNGLLATTAAEWERTLEDLLADAPLRERLGREGLRTVEERYSLAVWGPRLAALYRDLFAG